jgi:hypothetical protein
VQPCFFITGPAGARLPRDDESSDAFAQVLNREDMAELRAAIRTGARAECRTCVCSLWRDPGSVSWNALS